MTTSSLTPAMLVKNSPPQVPLKTPTLVVTSAGAEQKMIDGDRMEGVSPKTLIPKVNGLR